MTYSHLLIAVLSFAVGVLVMDIAHDLRAPPRALTPTPAQVRHVTPLVCAHLRVVNPTRGCV